MYWPSETSKGDESFVKDFFLYLELYFMPDIVFV